MLAFESESSENAFTSHHIASFALFNALSCRFSGIIRINRGGKNFTFAYVYIIADLPNNPTLIALVSQETSKEHLWYLFVPFVDLEECQFGLEFKWKSEVSLILPIFVCETVSLFRKPILYKSESQQLKRWTCLRLRFSSIMVRTWVAIVFGDI